jgi:hypothetical protein
MPFHDLKLYVKQAITRCPRRTCTERPRTDDRNDELRVANQVGPWWRPGSRHGVGQGPVAVVPPGWHSGAEGVNSRVPFRSVWCVSGAASGRGLRRIRQNHSLNMVNYKSLGHLRMSCSNTYRKVATHESRFGRCFTANRSLRESCHY